MGTYSSVAFMLPSSTDTGRASFTITGTLNAKPPDWPNFAIGLVYVDGPTDSVKVIMDSDEYTISRGGPGVAVLTGACPNPPFSMSMAGYIVFSKEGYYTFHGVSGYIMNSIFYVDDKAEKSITVKLAGGQPTGWADQVINWLKQNWVPVAITAGTVGTLAVVGAVAIREIKKK
jgi:hypothetical protein